MNYCPHCSKEINEASAYAQEGVYGYTEYFCNRKCALASMKYQQSMATYTRKVAYAIESNTRVMLRTADEMDKKIAAIRKRSKKTAVAVVEWDED